MTVYHSFHAEVDLFRQHWWKCETCSRIVKRSMNRPPQNADCPYRKPENDSLCTCAHHAHVKNCGGQFKKVSEDLASDTCMQLVLLMVHTTFLTEAKTAQ